MRDMRNHRAFLSEGSAASTGAISGRLPAVPGHAIADLSAGALPGATRRQMLKCLGGAVGIGLAGLTGGAAVNAVDPKNRKIMRDELAEYLPSLRAPHQNGPLPPPLPALALAE